MCKPGFSSDDLGDEFCYRPNCYVHSDLRMQKGCVPVFRRDDCCPWEWVCPRAGGGVTDDLSEVAEEGDEQEEPGKDSSFDQGKGFPSLPECLVLVHSFF